MTKPLVSIITPAYNAAAYLETSIGSVLNQSYENWELILVNDGSTDSTRAYLEALTDPRIHVIHQQNQGVSAARNTALDVVKGEYITFLDADDALPPNSLKMRVDYMTNHPEVDIINGGIEQQNATLSQTLDTYQPSCDTQPLLPKLMQLNSSVFFGVVYFFKSTLVKETRFSTGMTHCEDILFFLHLSYENTAMYGGVSDSVYWHRQGHPSAMSNLDGFDAGYLRLLSEIKKNFKPRAFAVLYLRYKIARILFLTRLRNGHVFLAMQRVVQTFTI